jgi:hypothetical protein
VGMAMGAASGFAATTAVAPSFPPASPVVTFAAGRCGAGAGVGVGVGVGAGGGGAGAWVALGAGARSSFLLHPKDTRAGTTTRAAATAASLLVLLGAGLRPRLRWRVFMRGESIPCGVAGEKC